MRIACVSQWSLTHCTPLPHPYKRTGSRMTAMNETYATCLDDLAEGSLVTALSWLKLSDMAGPTLCSKRLSSVSAADDIWKPLCERRWRGFFRKTVCSKSWRVACLAIFILMSGTFFLHPTFFHPTGVDGSGLCGCCGPKPRGPTGIE